MEGREERMKMSPAGLFVENALFPEKNVAIIPFFQNNKSPICRLNFDKEIRHIQTSNVPVEINKVTDFKRFTSPSITQTNEENKDGEFYQLKSSPMQMFNSFSSDSAYLSQTIGQKNGSLVFSEGKILNRKMCCNCKKSHCLKLYCECFTSKTYCQGCNCTNCYNTPANNEVREKAMQTTLERNPVAFDPKITRVEEPVYFHDEYRMTLRLQVILNILVAVIVRNLVVLRSIASVIRVELVVLHCASVNNAKTPNMKEVLNKNKAWLIFKHHSL
jgi:hypothetical protein